MELAVRFDNRFEVTVPSSDWRTHPDTLIGDHYLYGNGVGHHDLVNIPFYGRMYDTAIIAHPFSASDWLFDPRIKVTHIQFVMCQLRDIQRHARSDHRATLGELRARQDSIEVLSTLRRKAFERLAGRYFAQKANEAAMTKLVAEDSGKDFTACHSCSDSPNSTDSPEESSPQDSSPNAPTNDPKSAAHVGTSASIRRRTAYRLSHANNRPGS